MSETTERTIAMIGQRIRDLRQERQMTLQDLAAATSLSASMLSLVERGLASPSIGSLIVIGDALGKNMSALVVDDPTRTEDLVVRRERAQFARTRLGVVRRLMKEDSVNGVTLAINEYASGTGSNETPLAHAGHEFGIVLEGTLMVDVEGTSYALEVGDLISYSSRRPHRIWNPGPELARTIWYNILGS